MFRHLIARLLAASTVSAMLLAVIATPVAAAPTTRLVDDNGVQCPSAAYTSIQDAIDAANPGDKVHVCPGHYPEQLTIDKSILVKAKPLFQAHIDAPGTLAPASSVVTVVNISADNVTFRGFRIHIEAGPVVPTVRPSALSCAHADVAIWVQGVGDKVQSNKIDTTGTATLSGACGFDYGIVVGNHSVTGGVRPTGTGGAAAEARVTFNHVTNFKVGGILIEVNDSVAYVRRNDLRYLHEGEVILCFDICASQAAVANGAPVHYVPTFGIGVEDGARADIIRNAIRSGPCAGLVTDPSAGLAAGPGCLPTPTLNGGIMHTALDNADSNKVHHNSIWRTNFGIVTSPNADGAVYSDNHLTNNNAGFYMNSSDGEIRDNRVESNGSGIVMNGSATGNDIHDNDFRGNVFIDCNDVSSGGGGTAGTANTWTDNQGNSDNPDGICTPEL